jgi:hypothetical protein
LIQFLNVLQLILYIGGLALIGQAILFVFVGNKKDTNMFYQLFVILNKPWTSIAKLISPKMVAQRHIPVVAFCVVSVLYIAVTLAKIEHCVALGMVGCK